MGLKIVVSIMTLLVCTNKIFLCVAAPVKSNTSRKVGLDDVVKIANGWNVLIAEYPFTVSVQWRFGNKCGGTLIDPAWVMTGAVCISEDAPPERKFDFGHQDKELDKKDFSVVAGLTKVSCKTLTADDKGANNPNRRQVVDWHRHENYTSTTNKPRMWHNIAVIKLESAFGKDVKVSVGYLVPPDFNEPADVVAIGWGFDPRSKTDKWAKHKCTNNYHDLKGIYVVVAERSYCTRKGAILLQETQLCLDLSVDDTSFCNADMGGPLILKDGTSRVIGISSFIWFGDECSENKFGVYTRVAKYRDWIDKFVKVEERVPSRTSQLKQSLIYLILSIYVLLN